MRTQHHICVCGSREEGAVARDLALMWRQLASGARVDEVTTTTTFNHPLDR